MIKFEIGKVYGTDANVYEVIKKTAKTITYQEIAHYGRSNEKRYEKKEQNFLIGIQEKFFLQMVATQSKQLNRQNFNFCRIYGGSKNESLLQRNE